MFYDWNFSRIAPYWEAFLVGAIVTIELTILSVLIGSIAGVALGILMARTNNAWPLRFSIDLIRSIPLLPMMLFFYYLFTPQAIGFTVSSFWVAVFSLALSMAAFTADLVRAAISSIPAEVVDAGRALGFSEKQIIRHIVSRFTVKHATPGLAVLVIATLKNSSLAAVVNVGEVTYAAQSVLAVTARSLEVWTVVGVVYIALVLPTTYMARWLEKWARLGDRNVQIH
jgi:polar amino acid transport system permease protein